MAVDGKPIATVNELRNTVADLKPGGKVSFTIYRDGKKMDVPVTIEAQPQDMVAKFIPMARIPARRRRPLSPGSA